MSTEDLRYVLDGAEDVPVPFDAAVESFRELCRNSGILSACFVELRRCEPTDLDTVDMDDVTRQIIGQLEGMLNNCDPNMGLFNEAHGEDGGPCLFDPSPHAKDALRGALKAYLAACLDLSEAIRVPTGRSVVFSVAWDATSPEPTIEWHTYVPLSLKRVESSPAEVGDDARF